MLLLTARCFQFVCGSVSLWCVTLPTNSSPLAHLVVHIPPAPHQSSHFVADFSYSMDTMYIVWCSECQKIKQSKNRVSPIAVYHRQNSAERGSLRHQPFSYEAGTIGLSSRMKRLESESDLKVGSRLTCIDLFYL
jgi:hypothetical protein